MRKINCLNASTIQNGADDGAKHHYHNPISSRSLFHENAFLIKAIYYSSYLFCFAGLVVN